VSLSNIVCYEGHTSVPAKWSLIPSNGFNRVLTGLSISGTACQVNKVILLMLVAFLYLNKLKIFDFVWSLHRPVCFTVVIFSFVGHASVSFGTCVSRLLFK